MGNNHYIVLFFGTIFAIMLSVCCLDRNLSEGQMAREGRAYRGFLGLISRSIGPRRTFDSFFSAFSLSLVFHVSPFCLLAFGNRDYYSSVVIFGTLSAYAILGFISLCLVIHNTRFRPVLCAIGPSVCLMELIPAALLDSRGLDFFYRLEAVLLYSFLNWIFLCVIVEIGKTIEYFGSLLSNLILLSWFIGFFAIVVSLHDMAISEALSSWALGRCAFATMGFALVFVLTLILHGIKESIFTKYLLSKINSLTRYVRSTFPIIFMNSFENDPNILPRKYCIIALQLWLISLVGVLMWSS